jgi:hypothetical protein
MNMVVFFKLYGFRITFQGFLKLVLGIGIVSLVLPIFCGLCHGAERKKKEGRKKKSHSNNQQQPQLPLTSNQCRCVRSDGLFLEENDNHWVIFLEQPMIEMVQSSKSMQSRF